MYPLRRFKVPLPHRLRQFNHILYRILFQQVLVIEMVEEDVQAFFCVVDLRFKGGGGRGAPPRPVGGEALVDGTGVRGAVRAASGGWTGK